MKLFGLPTWGRSGLAKIASTGNEAVFSRACGAEVPRRANGLPAPNSRAAEAVRVFLSQKLPFGLIGKIADEEGRDSARFYREQEGSNALSWDWLDRAGSRLSLEDRLALGRFLMDRWGLRVEVGALPEIEVRP